jgi:hypothetical protein
MGNPTYSDTNKDAAKKAVLDLIKEKVDEIPKIKDKSDFLFEIENEVISLRETISYD